MAVTSDAKHRQDAQQSGFILVAALWILAALAVLTVTFTVYLSSSARALRLDDETVRTEALISAGIELTAYRLLLGKDDERPAQGAFRLRLGDDELDVSFLTEASRIDLNAAPKDMIANFFTVLGAKSDAAQEYAQRVVAWRKKPSGSTGVQSEEALYAAAGRNYPPRLAPFVHVDELALVLGPPPGLVERALPFVTVFSGAAGVDVLTAAPEVVAALPGMTPLALKDFLASRAGLPREPTAIAQALGPASASAAVPKNKAWRARIVARSAAGWRSASTVVIVPGGGENVPYRVVSRQDDGRSGREAARPQGLP
jgi:general secretion pathway protein K